MKTQMYLGCLFSSPIGAFIFLMERYIGYDSIGSAFSSPIGAFIFLMLHHPATNMQELKIFVPYRGFYFLNRNNFDIGKIRVADFRPLSGLLFS